MTKLIEPQPHTPNGHAGGDIASEELVGHGHYTGKGDDRLGSPKNHLRTHFDEPSLDYDAADVTITDETRGELVSIAARYPQARSALLPMLHLVQSAEGRV